jgi:hypothetical protein
MKRKGFIFSLSFRSEKFISPSEDQRNEQQGKCRNYGDPGISFAGRKGRNGFSMWLQVLEKRAVALS